MESGPLPTDAWPRTAAAALVETAGEPADLPAIGVEPVGHASRPRRGPATPRGGLGVRWRSVACEPASTAASGPTARAGAPRPAARRAERRGPARRARRRGRPAPRGDAELGGAGRLHPGLGLEARSRPRARTHGRRSRGLCGFRSPARGPTLARLFQSARRASRAGQRRLAGRAFALSPARCALAAASRRARPPGRRPRRFPNGRRRLRVGAGPLAGPGPPRRRGGDGEAAARPEAPRLEPPTRSPGRVTTTRGAGPAAAPPRSSSASRAATASAQPTSTCRPPEEAVRPGRRMRGSSARRNPEGAATGGARQQRTRFGVASAPAARRSSTSSSAAVSPAGQRPTRPARGALDPTARALRRAPPPPPVRRRVLSAGGRPADRRRP